MYKGTHEGDIDEIKFVIDFNLNPSKYKDYLSQFSNGSNLWMVRVTTKQYSQLSERKVFTRADCYLASFEKDISSIVVENDYLLTEDILEKKHLLYQKIPYSGISVKMTTSANFQILKTGPNSFAKLFGSYELGAGASLYCMKAAELIKNLDLIHGWNSTIEKMTGYFEQFTNGDSKFYLEQDICKKIKNYSCDKIQRLILDDRALQKKIFNGISLYEEPYTALYFYHGNKIEKLTVIPFSVTTGSGRSHGDYTIVLKP